MATIQLVSGSETPALDGPRAGVVAVRLAQVMGVFERPAGTRIDGPLIGFAIRAAAQAGLAEQVAAREDAADPGESTTLAFLEALRNSRQPAGRWHGEGEGPVQYTSSTPDAAWAEFLRHNGIVDPDDLAGVDRCLWAVEIADDEPTGTPALPLDTLSGGPATYPECRAEAARLRKTASRLVATSAAVLPATPSGWVSDPDLSPAPARDEMTIVLFGA